MAFFKRDHCPNINVHTEMNESTGNSDKDEGDDDDLR